MGQEQKSKNDGENRIRFANLSQRISTKRQQVLVISMNMALEDSNKLLVQHLQFSYTFTRIKKTK